MICSAALPESDVSKIIMLQAKFCDIVMKLKEWKSGFAKMNAYKTIKEEKRTWRRYAA
jgi:hypothetical protein